MRNQEVVKICSVCQNRYLTQRQEQKYCSNSCKYLRKTKSTKLTLSKKFCELCKKEFVYYSDLHRRFCSPSCASSYNNIKRGPHSEKTKDKIRMANLGTKIGIDNPAKRPEVRQKISAKLKGRDVYWLKGRKRPEHSKFMKHWVVVNGPPKGSGGKYSKIHAKVKSAINLLEFSFVSEYKMGNYFYDEVDDRSRLIVEVNGNAFHANPRLFSSLDYPNPRNKRLTAKDIWAYDGLKKEWAENLGYKVVYLWEDEIRKLSISELSAELDKKLKEVMLNGHSAYNNNC